MQGFNTYDSKYINADGFNLDTFSSLIKDIWNTYTHTNPGKVHHLEESGKINKASSSLGK